jgi:hypothetical protein
LGRIGLTMSIVIQDLTELIVACQQVQQGIQLLGTVIRQIARENVPFEIATSTSETLAIVEDGTFGLAAIQAELATFQATTATDVTAILTAIGTPQQAGVAVTLPDPPPAGYGGADGPTNAAAVWGDTAVYASPSKGYVLSLAETYPAVMLEFAQAKNPLTPLFRMFALPAGWLTAFPSDFPQPSQANILVTDTIFVWLQREAPAWTWADPLGNSSFVAALSTSNPQFEWIFNYSPAEFAEWQAVLLGPSATEVAPVWPGIANVVLGTAVALSTGLTLTEAMDGVLVTVTSVPPGTGFFQFDDVTSWRYIGAIAFVSDNGDEEFPQNLGFQTAVYCPRTMVHAAAVKLRTKPGIVGTIQAWEHA